ncbi:MAG: hypothetical protein KKF56_02325 [Nanoarchaeota archaeon]|nr:hypothetical protein [Nanoarchaeota archaeon]
MIVKILGVFDLIAGLIFWLWMFIGIPTNVMMVIVMYLIIKGLIFVIGLDIASVFDIIAGVLIYIAINFGMPKFLSIIVLLILVQKGIISILA